MPFNHPTGRENMVEVAAVILENQNGEILVARRKTGKKLAGFWEFPGGKIEPGESPRECLVRELQEEMNLVIEIGDYVGEHIHEYEEGPIRLVAYKGKIVGGEIKLKDHDHYLWLSPRDLEKENLAPADVFFIEKLQRRI